MTDASAGHDSRAVANAILKIAQDKKLQLTIMQLLKLAYFAHGWSLAGLDRPLSKHHAQAWQYGPVFPHIYRSYPGVGSRPVTEPIIDKLAGRPYSEQFSADEWALLDYVVEGYGRAHAFTLSDLTHAPGSPWDQIFRTKGAYSEIPNDLIKQYFKASMNGASRTA